MCEKMIVKSHFRSKYRGAAQSIYNLKYILSRETFIWRCNGPNYDFYLRIKNLVREFDSIGSENTGIGVSASMNKNIKN